MATILEPAATRAIAVHTSQPLTLVADTAGLAWWVQTNGGGWSNFATPVGTSVVYTTSSSVARRFTFDDVQIAITTGATPTSANLFFNLCEGPATVLNVTPRIRNEALQEPPSHPDMLESDDPPLGFPLAMPGANRDGLGTVLLERAYEAGGPANLVSLYGPGLFVDSAGKLGARTPIGRNRGLGPFPSISSYHYSGFYFAYDFGRSRMLSLTRVLFADTSGNVAIVRGDGRRNTYRNSVGTFTAQASCQNTLTLVSGTYTETLPSGRQLFYNSSGQLQKIVDRYGNPAYYLYDVNSKLQKIQGVPTSGSQGLVPYLAYDGSGRCSIVCLQDSGNPANNRTSYLTYDGSGNLIKLTSPELCTAYYTYDGSFNLLSVTDSENFTWNAGYDVNGRVNVLADALGQAAYFSYDTNTPITTWVDRVGKATYFVYNAFGSPTRVGNLGTPYDYFRFDGEANLTSSQNRLANNWYYQYDGSANRISATDPLTARSYFAYDSGNFELKTFTDALGRQVSMTYDASRNMTQKVDPIGNTAYYAYTTTGLTSFKKDRRGAFTYFVFDAAANLTAARDPLNNTTYFAYSSAGDRTATVDPLGRVSYWNYDRKSRVVSSLDPLKATRYYAYDAACNLVTEVDPRNFTTYHFFDGNDNQTKAVDPLGNATYLRYDAEERILGRKDARLNETVWTYDVLGRRQKQTDALGGVSYWGYDAAHEVVVQLDPNNNATYIDYDLVGRTAHVVDAYLNATYMGYDLKGNRVKSIDKRGNATITYYEPRDLVAYTQNAIGAFNYFQYDAELNRTVSVDALGQPSYMNYDLRGLVTSTQDAYNSFTYWEYDAARQKTKQLLPPQNGTSVLAPTYWDYDLAGRQRNTTDAYLNVSYMTYDLSGNLILTLDQRQATNPTVFQYFLYDPVNRQVETRNLGELRTYYYFDAVGNRVQVDQEQGYGRQPFGTSPYGGERVSTYFTFDALNRQSTGLSATSLYSPTVALTYTGYDAASNRVQTRVENPRGGADVRFSYWTYDRLNRVATAVDPNATTSGGVGGVAYFGYDPNSNRVLVVDQEGRPTYFVFDQINRTYYQYDAFRDVTYMIYDLRNSLVKRIDPVGRTLYYDYDNLRRQIHQSNALGQVSYTGYDARSERVISQNPRGFSTYFTYDLLGRLATQKDALNGVRYVGYDEVGNKVLALDELSNPTYWHYDQANRVRLMTDVLGGQFYYGYDAAGSVRQTTDADGRYTFFGYYGYDASRRPTTMMFSDPVMGETADPWIYYTYDSLGNLFTVSDRTGTFTSDYDFLNRKVTKRTLAGNVYFQYDRTGLRTMTRGPDGGGTYHAYDAAGRLLKATVFQSGVGGGIRPTYYTYDASGMRTAKVGFGNNVIAYYLYDNAGRTTIVNNVGPSVTSTVSYFFYERDANGNITSTTREAQQIGLSGQNIYYAYDPLDRLTLEEHKTSTTTYFGWQYAYDPTSNRYFKYDEIAGTRTYYYYNGLNELTAEVTQ